MMRYQIVACVIAWAVAGASLPAQRVTSDELIAKAAAYMAEQLPRLTNVVAEEQQVQQTTSPRRKRTLVSDYLIVQLQGSGEFASFRDVFQVDGTPVRDRDERLQKLFIDARGDALEQASNIAREGARHNIWDIGTVNNPYLAMAFVQEKYRSRFRYQSPRQERSMGPDIWSLVYQEYVVPTIIKGNGNRDMFARGRYWIDATTGRIVETELRFGANAASSGFSPIEVTVDFVYDETLMLNVPARMSEFYPATPTGDVRGEATYSRFRRFGVSTSETVAP